jgi:hypothetical protein
MQVIIIIYISIKVCILFVDCYEHGNKPSDSVKGRELFCCQSKYCHLKRTLFHVVSYIFCFIVVLIYFPCFLMK